MSQLKPNSYARNLEFPDGEQSLSPEPLPLLKQAINFDILRELENKSILGVGQLTKDQVVELSKLAATLETIEVASHHPLDGKLIITAFFEPSTRTRISFESATLRLDGKVISIPEGGVTGIAKGESLRDIGEMFNAYGDAVIMRHTATDSIHEISERLRIPLINAGNGTGEHPTQALTDWYALIKWQNTLILDQPKSPDDQLHLGILGTPGSMRTVKSFLLMALKFQEHIRKVTIVSEMSDPFGDEVTQELTNAGIDFSVTNNLQDVIIDLDVIYMNSITMVGDSYRNLDKNFKLNAESNFKKGAVVLHPLARLDELDTSLDETSHNLYFTQAHGSVFIRQALLMSVLGRLDRLPSPVTA